MRYTFADHLRAYNSVDRVRNYIEDYSDKSEPASKSFASSFDIVPRFLAYVYHTPYQYH